MMKRHIVHALVLLAIAFLASCGESGEINKLFHEADELMNTRPDSALCLLEEVRPEVASCPRSQRMRHELLVAKAMNKAYVDFTTDSVMLAVTDYYDHHGTPNERMLAHYLLGCTYRDLGEAPRTLECYKDAVACADTLSADCDFKVLSSVCSQMADVLHKQFLLSNEIACRRHAYSYSQHCKDTLHMAYETCRIAGAYCLLNYNDSIEPLMQRGKNLYRSIHEEREWIDFSAILMNLYIKQHATEKLGLLINDFLLEYKEELESIPQNKKQFFYYIGQYYELSDSIDIAESWYRKIEGPAMRYADKEPLYKGLLGVFRQKHQADSIAKYALLYGEANDSTIAVSDRETTAKFSAMYDYARNQQIAYEEKMKREKAHRALLSVAFLFMLTVIAGSLLYRRKAKEKAREISRVANQYLNASSLYERAKGEMEQMELNHVAYQQAKQAELDELRDTMERYRIDYDQLKLAEKRAGLEQSDVVTLFRDMAQMKAGKKVPSKSDWNELQRVVSQARPDLYAKIAGGGILSEQELQICLLTSLGFSNSDQTILLNVVPQRITNAKRRIGEKLFSDPSARSLEAHLSAI